MAYLKSKRLLGVVCILALLVVALVFALPRTEAQVAAGDEAAVITPSVELTAEAAVERTWAEMEADAAKALPAATTGRKKPFRTTISDQEYQQLKAQAAAAPGQEKAVEAAPGPAAPPILRGVNFDGLDRNTAVGTDGVSNFLFTPPDTHGAVGRAFTSAGQSHNYYMEVNNSHVRVWNVNTVTGVPVQTKSVPLNTFFGYLKPGYANAQLCFDPQAIYDPVWNRWIVTAPAFPENPGLMRFWMAISKTNNPNGAYWIYSINVAFGGDRFFDYPHIGMDQDAIITTANLFVDSTGAFVDGRLFAVAKARLYNGLGWAVPVFTGLQGSIAAPMVLDNNNSAFLVSAAPNANFVRKYALLHSSRAIPNLSAVNIAVPAYTLPPNAPQPGTAALLDTLDSRFVNYSTQTSDRLFQVHTIRYSAAQNYAVPQWYEFNTATNLIVQTGKFYRSGTSHDFNASICANAARSVYVTWSATVGGAAGVNAEVRYSGRTAADAANVIPAGFLLSGSATFYTGFRWGDYSAVCLDPSNSNRAWLVNEMIKTNATWGSRIGRIGF